MTRFANPIVAVALATVALSGCSDSNGGEAAPTPGASAPGTPTETTDAKPSSTPSVRAKPTTREATQFAQLVADAAAHRDQGELPTPTAAGGHWRDLVSYLGGHDPYVHCRRASFNSYDCGVAHSPQGADRSYFYVSRISGVWKVMHASNVVY